MIKKALLTLLATLFFSAPAARAELKTHEFGGIIYVEQSTVEELENLFKSYGYERFRALNNDEFPAIFVERLPSDYTQIQSLKYRNELFIRMLTPLALKLNEEILNERETLLRLERDFKKNDTLSPENTKKLENLATKYDYFTRLKGTDRIKAQLEGLKPRIDMIPLSIFVAAAAIESNWGDSRLATEANSLYKEKVWFTNEGLEPLENKDDGYRFKVFDTLIDCMRSFALTFNSNINYEFAWKVREGMTERHGTVLGESIALSLSTSSNLPNYIGILDYTAAFYDLLALDIGHLKKGLKKNEH